MKKLLLLALFTLCGIAVSAQNINVETEAVKKVINRLFDGMRRGDSLMVNSIFSKGMIMQSISNKEGTIQVRTDDAAGF